jgi:hypothetical protein
MQEDFAKSLAAEFENMKKFKEKATDFKPGSKYKAKEWYPGNGGAQAAPAAGGQGF